MISWGRIKVRYAIVVSCLLLLLAGHLLGRPSSTAGASSSEIAPSAAAEPSPPPTSLCISDALTNTDFVYNRAGTTPPCTVFTTGNIFDAYTFTVSGCSPATVTVSTCTGPCGTQTSLDTVVFVYQKPGGAAATPADPIFKPANPCTNLVASSNNFCALSSQVTSILQTTAGSGDFVVIVTSNLTGQTGPYNLNVSSATCTIVQQPLTCVYVLSPTEQTFQMGGGTGSVTLTAQATCGWTAASNDSFIHVTSGASGLGNGTVNYSVDANTGAARIGTMTIAGQTFTVTQEAGSVSLPCIQDALVAGNSFVRPSSAGAVITCPPGPPPNPTVFYKAYELTLSGCASGIVTASTCGTLPCSGPASTLADTILFIYRKSDGSPSTPGSPIFNPATPCINAVASNNNFAACGTLSQVSTALSAGSFVVVVTSNGAGQTGTFNLSITVPGCTVSFVPPCSSITGAVSGGGTICAGGSSIVTVTLTGGTAPYTVTLDNGGGTQSGSSPLNFTVSPAATTTYSVASGTDSASCPVTGSGSATVTVNQPPTTATVGGPQTICGNGTTAGLGGNTPTVGTGSWSVVSGGSGTFNPSATTPNATFTHTGGAGPIVVRWTISNPPCTDSTADVTITITPAQTATAGGPQTICSGGTTTGLGGNTPASGTGSWSIVSGGTGTFNPGASSPNATFTHTGGAGPIVVRWTISNPPCSDSTADVTITINQPPTASNAGPDQSVCGTTATLAGNAPSVGTGTWTLVSGTGTITNPSSPTSTVTGLGVGPNVFRWTITNSPCPASMDDVTITRDATPPTALCKNITVALSAGGTASITASQVDNGSSDNCGIGSLSVAPNTFTCANKGPNTVTLTVTDVNGNSSQCNATVTIVDNTPPTIICPANVSATATTGQSSATVTYPNPTASDNCPGVTTACSPPSGSAFPLGTTTVICTATDTSNNQASCSFTVKVSGTLFVNADSFLRDGADNTNEGGNNLLRIQSSGHNRVLVRFNLSGIPTAGLQSATLILNITDNSDNWGPTGRLVDANRLLADWTEGNGHTVGDQPNFRGTGEGVTWNCAKDSNIANMNDDCVSQWNGGAFAAATASPVLHTNGQLGDVSWNVTADVLAGASNGWVIKKQNEGQNGQVKYYSKEGAAVAGNPSLGPRLVLVYQ